MSIQRFVAIIPVSTAILVSFTGCRPAAEPEAPAEQTMSGYDYALPTPAPAPTYSAPASSYSAPTPAHAEPVAASSSATAGGSRGTATCDHANGYHTVSFSDGSSYTGHFADCKPIPGPARFEKGSVVLDGYATRGPGGMVLKTATHEVTISLR